MIRKLMLSLIVALAATGCEWEAVGLCADRQVWVDDELQSVPNTDPACQGLVEEPTPDLLGEGSN